MMPDLSVPSPQTQSTFDLLRSCGSSRLGQILAHSAVCHYMSSLREWTAPTFEVVCNTHKLAEFPAYESAETSRNDEPGFWDYNWPTPIWSADVADEKANEQAHT